MVVIIVILRLLLVSTVGAQKVTCLLKAVLVLAETVGISMVVIRWNLMAMQIAEGWLVEWWKDIFLIVVLEVVIEWLGHAIARDWRR